MNPPLIETLFAEIASQIKLCKCRITTIESSERNQRDSNGLDAICPTCNAVISSKDHYVIRRLRTAFLQTVERTGLNLKTIIPPKNVDEIDTSEYNNHVIRCEAKYLKRNAKGETPLHTVVRKKDLQSVIAMLQNGVNPNVQDNAGWTPLHEALFTDNEDITWQLLSAGAIVNVPGYDFTTPIHIAAHHNNLSMVQLLLKFGADPMARDISGRLPEYYSKNDEILAHLKAYAACPSMIETAKRFQKKAAPRPVTIYLIDEDIITKQDQSRLEYELNIKFSENLDKTVTHVVVNHMENNVCEPSLNVLKGILMGCIVVNRNWLVACNVKTELVSFNEYEVNGTTKYPTSNGPRKARNNFLNLNPPLFTGCHMFLKKTRQIHHLKDLVLASGAKLLNREPNPEHALTEVYLYHCPVGHQMEGTVTIILYETGPNEPALKYNMKHIKSLSTDWFFDCVQTFSIQQPESNDIM